MNWTTALRLAVIGAAVTALAGCMPILVDRDGNWRGQQPPGPAFGSALHADDAEEPASDAPAAEEPVADEAEEPAAE